MLTKFAAALLATSLIAGSAFAAQPAATTGTNTAPAAQTQSTPAPSMNKAGKTVKHSARHRSHGRKHFARHGKTHVVRHTKAAKQANAAKSTGTHQAHVGKSQNKSEKRS